ncbi:hypothetical protein GSJ18_04260 [Bordetella pertussis]|uniref:hypothetical protein n=4 Tax=Bordetella pertussis TaxID=520 RepID=UPI0002F227D0|nr:hypothetical protein [Bordetella pertussis]ETH58008.1 hypothetical protein L553_0644 [Bordetella pertussis I036]QSY77941.1 hypothetical protein J3Q24_16980 [Bordetella pertussis]ULX89211.1 hypothetical protein HRK15_04260 [Bordetella pertussis]ULX99872.1 hypothetical protein HRK12_04250 [Bordetella pertussis]ULY07269.1 hypothetical protein HRK11_04255 [Bordetella pertussis]
MNWGGGDFQFLKSGSDEPCIQPIESSQLARARFRIKGTGCCNLPTMGRETGFFLSLTIASPADF